MADIQKYFIQFDDTIRLERDDEKAKLSEKRKRVLDRLSEGIKRQRDEGQEIPRYNTFNQGSYAMNTGVKPRNGDYDIDVGVRFELAINDHSDPVKVKEWVFNAVDGHTKKVEMRRSCVTVFYQEAGEDVYHVDLAVYSGAEKNPDRQDYLAKGKQNSATEHRIWEQSDPQGLCDRIAECRQSEHREQFRRVIRAMKRWKDERFSKDGNAAPKGIALTAAAYHWFQPSTRTIDAFANKTADDDLDALDRFVQTMIDNFQQVWSDEEQRLTPRLKVGLPVVPYSDLCAKMTNPQMRDFKERLGNLKAALEAAKKDDDAHSACKELQKHFGDDFPVPDKIETAEKRGRAITSSGNSA
ncbi:cyclic GMP-AMP synthase DncV-like nucleotidyltransferase [Sorangium sp. So ce590]|uniref:cyclic GMP-AMP synthase DncV-like nucleotidyltransferase n=1 Tax=Sorangium sp. So ce590 TaxID=3133317 RepID=UPI003F5DFBB7